MNWRQRGVIVRCISIYNSYYFIILSLRTKQSNFSSQKQVSSKRNLRMDFASQANIFQNIPVVAISEKGIFKYILIQCQGQGQINGKQVQLAEYFVRGDKTLGYHYQNFEKFMKEIKNEGFQIKKRNPEKGHFQAVKQNLTLKFWCPGGGRIEHNYGENLCFIYGYSQSYGRVDHTIAQKLLSAALNYPLNQIKTSQQGY